VGGKDENDRSMLGELQTEDLLKFGLIPEFVGRLPIITSLHDLDEAALVRIMKEPKNALTKQYTKLFEMENVKLTFTDGSLEAISREALERKSGARGLRAIMENIMLDAMYDVPSMPDVEEVVISKEVVEKKEKPLMVFSSASKVG